MAEYTYHQALSAVVANRIQELKDGLAAGNSTIEQYNRQCGIIRGLQEALEYSDEIKKKLLGESR